VELRQFFNGAVYAAARRGNTIDFLNDALTFVILELDFELGFVVLEFYLTVVLDVTFALEDFEYVSEELRRLAFHYRKTSLLAVTDQRKHVGETIIH
jgi:hypothetical protein